MNFLLALFSGFTAGWCYSFGSEHTGFTAHVMFGCVGVNIAISLFNILKAAKE